MATFVLTTKNNIPLGCGLSPIPKCEQCIIRIGTQGVTPSTLFSNFQSKDILAQQLNREFGTGNFFTKDNVGKFFGYFNVTLV